VDSSNYEIEEKRRSMEHKEKLDAMMLSAYNEFFKNPTPEEEAEVKKTEAKKAEENEAWITRVLETGE
jgi:hypothetical protein